MTTFISKEEVFQQLNRETVRIIDCRFKLGEPDVGAMQFKEGHLPGALYFHLEKDLSGDVAVHGGRHPLPMMDDFQALLESAGITNETTVIAYDGGEGAFAARLWWLMQYVGHKEVYILDGGFSEWKTAGYPVSDKVNIYSPSVYEIQLQPQMLAEVSDVRKAIGDERVVLIDSRERKRYLGIEEPIDKKAGHIPTAIHKAWMEGFEHGHFKGKDKQSERFKELDKEQPVIVYCGSGITATPNYIALKEAGFTNVKLYAGSFSDWISYDEHEIETDK